MLSLNSRPLMLPFSEVGAPRMPGGIPYCRYLSIKQSPGQNKTKQKRVFFAESQVICRWMDEDNSFQVCGTSQVGFWSFWGDSTVFLSQPLCPCVAFTPLLSHIWAHSRGRRATGHTSEEDKENRDVKGCFLLSRAGWQRWGGACLTLVFKQ